MPHADTRDKPTIEYLREFYDSNQRYWEPQVRVDNEVRLLILGEHLVKVPDTKAVSRKNRWEPERMTTGLGGYAVDGIASLYTQPAGIGTRWAGQGARRVEEGEHVEIALNELFRIKNPPTDSPRLRSTKKRVGLGRSADLILPDEPSGYWRQEPSYTDDMTEVQKKAARDTWRWQAPVPITWRDLPPESTFPASIGRLDEEVLSTLETTYWELYGMFEKDELQGVMPDDHKEWADKCILTVYANRQWLVYAVLAQTKSGGVMGSSFGATYQDKPLREIEHKMGRCPMRILAGKTGAWKEPGIFWQSALFPVLESLPQNDAFLSTLATAARETSLPRWKLWMNNRSETGAARIRKMMQGDIVDLDNAADQNPREDMEPLFNPNVGSEMFRLWQLHYEMMRRQTGWVDALEGVATGVDTAWERKYEGELAKGGLRPLTDAVIAADLDYAESFLRAAYAFGEEFPIQRQGDDEGSVVMKPSYFETWAPVLKGEYQPRIPIDERAVVAQGLQLMSTVKNEEQPIDLFWIMENFMGIKQPLEHFKNALRTRFLVSDPMSKWYLGKMLEEADVRVAAEEAMSLDEAEAAMARDGVPEATRAIMRRKAGGGAGQNGAGGQNALRSVTRATSPFESASPEPSGTRY